MGARISSTSMWDVRVLLVGGNGPSMQNVLQQLLDDGTLKRSSVRQRLLNARSSTSSLRNSSILSESLRESKPEDDDEEKKYRFQLNDIPFSLIHSSFSSPTLASTSLQDKMQAHVGKIDMVLFVVPLSWYDEKIAVDDENSKVNRMELALSQFCTLCEIFANTDAGVGVILEDYAGLFDKLTIPGAGDKIGKHFLDYCGRDECNPTAAARYFEKRFKDIYNAHSACSNCFVYVARDDKRSNRGKTKMNDLTRFLLESSKSVLRRQSLLIEEESELDIIKLGKPHTDTAKGKSGNSKNLHWMATTDLNDSITSISTTEDDSCNTTSYRISTAFVA